MLEKVLCKLENNSLIPPFHGIKSTFKDIRSLLPSVFDVTVWSDEKGERKWSEISFSQNGSRQVLVVQSMELFKNKWLEVLN